MNSKLFSPKVLNRIVGLLFVFTFLPACASMTQTKNSGYRWGLIGAAVPVGGAIGAATAPDNLDAGYNAAAWAGGMGLVAAIVGEIFFSDKEEIDSLQSKVTQLGKPELKLIEQKKGIFRHPAHPEYTKETPWNIYEANEWSSAGAKQWKHQDMLIELAPKKKSEK